MASGFIIQWNWLGLAANRQELELISHKYTASVICLQVTNLRDDQMTLIGYVAYHKSGTIYDMDRAHGGVSLFVKSNLPQSLADVNSPLQTIVVKVTLHTTITFCNLYIPPRNHTNALLKRKWQSQWDEAANNKLHEIHPQLGLWPGGYESLGMRRVS